MYHLRTVIVALHEDPALHPAAGHGLLHLGHRVTPAVTLVPSFINNFDICFLPANFFIWESHGLILIGETIPHIDVKHMEVTGVVLENISLVPFIYIDRNMLSI